MISRRIAFTAVFLSLTVPAYAQDWQLVWSDEFDGTVVDTSKWSFQTGDGCPELCGWGNNELQTYRPENASVANGVLSITAREQSVDSADYTSARLLTKDKGDWTYGRFEVRARMPFGQGMWPAIWMLPTDTTYGGWAASGEIDIVEVLGHDPARAYGTIHYGATSPGNVFTGNEFVLQGETFADDFHVFAVDWSPGVIHWYVDDTRYATLTDWFSTAGPFPAPFDQDFHLLLNLAVGGSFPGNPDSTTIFPQVFEVDYVRVYEADNVPPTVEITSPRDGATIRPNRRVIIQADAEDSDGSVLRVRFFQGDALLEEDANAPYSIGVEDVPEGCYVLRADAIDNLGGLAISDSVAIRLGSTCVQAPYRMGRAAIPGMIEVEEYDIGGPAVAYADADPEINLGNTTDNGYRAAEGVDIAPTNDVGLGSYVGWLEAGEWLEYQIDIKQEGEYNVDLRVAADSLTSGLLHLEIDGTDVTGPVALESTGGDDTWSTVRVEDVLLTPGTGTLRVAIDEGGFNLNSITFSRAIAATTEPTLFDGFEDGDAGDWNGMIEVLGDRPAVGEFYISTSWSGSGDGFYGGIYRNLENDLQTDIPEDPWVNLFVYHESAGTTVEKYRLELTVREDTDGNGYTNGQDDSRRLDVWFDADSFNDQWILVSAPADSMLDLGTGTNGFLEGKVDEVFIGIAQIQGPDPSNVEVDFDHLILTSGAPFVGEATAIEKANEGLPDSGPALRATYPNPFGTRAAVSFALNRVSHVEMDLFDTLGRRVRHIAEGVFNPGDHVTVLDGSDLGAGVYFLRFRIDGRINETQVIVKN